MDKKHKKTFISIARFITLIELFFIFYAIGEKYRLNGRPDIFIITGVIFGALIVIVNEIWKYVIKAAK